MSNWRIGRKVPVNVYDGDRPVCQCHNEQDAQAIVLAMQAQDLIREALESPSLTETGKLIVVANVARGPYTEQELAEARRIFEQMVAEGKIPPPKRASQ